MTATALSPLEFAEAIEQHHFEAADDARKMIVGLQEEVHQAEIYAKFAHLYTAEQVAELAVARDAATSNDEREQLNRLWFEAADALAAADVVQASQDLTNDWLAFRTKWDGSETSLNELSALLNSEEDFDRRESIYQLVCEADEFFAPRQLELATKSQQLRSDVFVLDGEVSIAAARMGIDIDAFGAQIRDVADKTQTAYVERSKTLFPYFLGREELHPSRAHAQKMRSLSEYNEIYSREKMVPVCEQTLAELGFALDSIPTIKPDLEDRPQKNPRACVIPTRVPDEVYLIVRPTGGINDYQAFLHEAGHALHYGLSSGDLPFAYRALSPDNALTEIYSYVIERITHEPAWHSRHFGVSQETAEEVCAKTRFIDSMLFRRYAAKLTYELQFWPEPNDPRNPDRYAMLLSNFTSMKYPTSQFVSDMDAGLYAADYLRAWRTSESVLAMLRDKFGPEWFVDKDAGTMLRELFVRGTEPTNEAIGESLGFAPTNFDALIQHLNH